MNAKKAKALRKVLKLTKSYIEAPLAHLKDYIETNVRTITNPFPPHNTVTSRTLTVPNDSKRGIYLLQKKRV